MLRAGERPSYARNQNQGAGGVGREVAAIALSVGIEEASVVRLYVHGPNLPAEQVSVEVSTPKGKAFVDAVMDTSGIEGLQAPDV